MKATVVIPTRNRASSTQRAVNSIINQNGAEECQIVVIDDASDFFLELSNLRQQDLVIRLTTRVGGAIARNIGIEAAVGEIIYLLDSDDYFINRDFCSDYALVRNSSFIYYCNIQSSSTVSSFPDFISYNDYLKCIFSSHEGVACTSTLVFSSSLSLRFDPELPKHQDWDLVLSYLLNYKEGMIVKIGGLVYMDRDDSGSISRILDFRKSIPWLEKVRNQIDSRMYRYVFYNVLYYYKEMYTWKVFFLHTIEFIFSNKLSILRALKNFRYKFLCHFNNFNQ